MVHWLKIHSMAFDCDHFLWFLMGLWLVGAILGLVGKDWYEDDDHPIPLMILGQMLRAFCIYCFAIVFGAIMGGILGKGLDGFMAEIGFFVSCYYSVKHSADADDLFNGKTIFGKKKW